MTKPRKSKASTRIRKAEAKQPRKRLSESPIQRMKHRRSLNVYELTAADEILAAYQMTIGVPVTRDPDLGIPPCEPRADAADESAAKRVDLVRVYARWRMDVMATQALLVTQSVVIGQLPLRDVERECKLRNGQAREHLLTGLRHFAALRGNTPRGARDWKLKPKAQENATNGKEGRKDAA